LIDALDIMKQGVKRLLVPKSGVWKCVSKKFSVLYNGKWLKNIETSTSGNNSLNRPSSSNANGLTAKFCCLSREDITRFLIGCLGALAPIPLTSISALGAINPHFYTIEACLPAIQATKKVPLDPIAVAVVEHTPDGHDQIIGEISASKLWKCDYLAAAHALSSLSAGQFVMGVEENATSRSPPDVEINPAIGGENDGGGSVRPKKFSSRSIGFFSSSVNPSQATGRSLYRGRSAPLTCKETSSLAAVMAQMLSHRATHIWVTKGEDNILTGVVGYGDILHAVTRSPPSIAH